MIDATRSRTEVLRQGIVDAANETAALLAAGDAGAKASTCLERGRALATELKTLAQRMGSEEGYEDAIQMLAMIENLQAALKARADKSK
jgi:hypothetical protein